MSASVAQDQAFAALASRRGLLPDASLVRGLAAAKDLAARGEILPLAQVLVRQRLIAAAPATELLRELAEGSFRCRGCNASYTHDALARLAELRCAACAGAIDPEPIPPGIALSHSVQKTVPARKAFGPYELERELGRGCMGVVYLARRAGIERPFALKVMLAGDAGNAELVARFEREAKVAARLDHPGIVAVVDRGVANGYHYYAMEFCAGETLQSRLRKGPLPLAEAVTIVRELADAVAVAHEAGVVHRDLKPANVIMDETSGKPRITDFGLARDLMAARSLTRTGDLVGTPLYMAPEQVRAEKDVDGRADIYALGVMFFELLSGEWPFLAPTAAELGQLILTGAPRSIRAVLPGVPPSVDAIIAKAMARSRDERFENARALRDALDELRGRPRATKPGRARVHLAVLALLLTAGGAVALFFVARALARAGQKKTEAAAAKLRAESEQRAEEQHAQEVDALLAQAEERSRSKADDALFIWKSARVSAGNDPRAELAFARFLLRRGRAGDALGVLTPVVERTRSAKELGPEARFLLGQALLRISGLQRQGRDALGKVALEDAATLQGKLAHAQLLALDGHVAPARQELEAILATDKDVAFAHKLLARLATDGYEPRTAIPHYFAELRSVTERDRMDREAATALAHASRAIELSPDDADAYVVRSMVRIYLVFFRSQTGSGRDPHAPDLESLKGDRKRDLDDAIRLAEPEPDPCALGLRARFRYLANADQAAIVDLDRALVTRPDDIDALVLHAVVDSRSDPARGMEPIRRAMTIDSRATWSVARHLANLDAQGPRWILAVAKHAWASHEGEFLEKYVQEQAERREARIQKARPEARSLLRAGQELAHDASTLDVLRPSYDKAIAAAPGDPWPVLELARLLLGRARPHEALATLARMPGGADPDEVAWLRAEAFFRLGRNDEAKAAFEQLALSSAGARRCLAAAGACRAAGDEAGARARAEEAIRAAPGDPEGHRVLAESLLMGPAAEPDAAYGEAELAMQIAGVEDADVFFDVLFSALLVTLDDLAALRLGESTAELDATITQGFEAMAKVATSARFHAVVAEGLMAAPEIAGLRHLAQKQLDAALSLEPEDARTHIMVGAVCVTGDDVDGALDAWRRARAIEPGVKLPPAALEQLRKLAPDRVKELEH